MESRRIMGFVVYVDDKPLDVRESLDEAKKLAEQHKSDKPPLRIESMVAPAPTRFWYYDYDIGQWVEADRPPQR